MVAGVLNALRRLWARLRRGRTTVATVGGKKLAVEVLPPGTRRALPAAAGRVTRIRRTAPTVKRIKKTVAKPAAALGRPRATLAEAAIAGSMIASSMTPFALGAAEALRASGEAVGNVVHGLDRPFVSISTTLDLGTKKDPMPIVLNIAPSLLTVLGVVALARAAGRFVWSENPNLKHDYRDLYTAVVKGCSNPFISTQPTVGRTATDALYDLKKWLTGS